jgi:hypothetical protein
MRQPFICHLHQFRGLVGGSLGDGGDGGQRLSGVAHRRIAVPGLRVRITHLCLQQLALEHVNRTDAGIPLRRGGINRDNPGVGNRAHDAPRIQHAGQVDIECISRRAGDLLNGVGSRN